MKSIWLVLSALFFLSSIPSFAQTAAADVTINYTLPTTNTDGTAIPATGPNSIAKVRFFLSTSSVPADLSGLTPTLEAPPGSTNTVSGFSAAVGDVIHIRAQVCNAAGTCGLASNEVTKTVVAATPGAATINTITITIK